jgi:hypothetical protein
MDAALRNTSVFYAHEVFLQDSGMIFPVKIYARLSRLFRYGCKVRRFPESTTFRNTLTSTATLTVSDQLHKGGGERQVEFYSQNPIASTESSTMGFLPDSVNRTNETGGRYVLKDAARYLEARPWRW